MQHAIIRQKSRIIIPSLRLQRYIELKSLELYTYNTQGKP